jgi:DNA-binding transcriptional LysR family regulator
MQTFVRIVDGGSLTAAASALGSSPPTVVRSLAALEAALGVRLLNRTTRRLSLTDEGREYYERCQRVLAEVEGAEAALLARRTAPRGRLRLTAPVMFGRLHVAPVVAGFLAKHPAVEVELLLLDRVVDLVEEGIDAAVRIGQLPESSLVVRRVGETRRVVCASPAYWKRAGTPKAPRELTKHRCIGFSGLAPGHEWSFRGSSRERVAIRPVLATNQIDVAIDACLRGAGCTQLLSYQVETLLESGRLRRVLRDFEPPPLPIHIVYPQARLLSSNVRAFVDFAVPRLLRPA